MLKPMNPVAGEIVRAEQLIRDIDAQIAELTLRKAEHLSVISSLESTGLAEWETVEDEPEPVDPDTEESGEGE